MAKIETLHQIIKTREKLAALNATMESLEKWHEAGNVDMMLTRKQILLHECDDLKKAISEILSDRSLKPGAKSS